MQTCPDFRRGIGKRTISEWKLSIGGPRSYAKVDKNRLTLQKNLCYFLYRVCAVDCSGYMDEDLKQTIKTLGHFSTIGLAMAFSVSLGALLGNYLDGKFGTTPWLTMVFLAFGIAAAFRNLYLLYKRAKKC
jgi:ATP synthase protein I